MRKAATEYWRLRQQITKQKYDLGFNKFAYRQDQYYSGEDEAWEDFGSKISSLDMKLELLTTQFGSVAAAFNKMKQNLLVDTDAILNAAFAILKGATNARSVTDIAAEGRRVIGYDCHPEDDADTPFVLVKDLIWYGRNQANHYMDPPGQAVSKLTEFRSTFADNLAEAWHPVYADDINIYFIPEAKISMSDEIIRILGWRKFEDFEQDLLEYIPAG
jgi:hypothetical protein